MEWSDMVLVVPGRVIRYRLARREWVVDRFYFGDRCCSLGKAWESCQGSGLIVFPSCHISFSSTVPRLVYIPSKHSHLAMIFWKHQLRHIGISRDTYL
ncbi:uncharacterized protein LAJ45_01591 [Morchella importuna]|uniref:uncharacterized protein n=1 Tax=Morchella importuna TaxID=1174673 RepID=UPI001E8E4EFB|nr:uncharacterized protein LAJ45_01591 [Morchella importuna]KAH8153824.1 hypothetical protein LAJ45_01591 [Morchella importuna]